MLGLAFLNVLGYWMIPVMTLANGLLLLLITPLTFFLS